MTCSPCSPWMYDSSYTYAYNLFYTRIYHTIPKGWRSRNDRKLYIYNIILPHDLSLYVWQCATKKHLQHYIASRSQPLCLAVCNHETFTTLYCLMISAFMSGSVQPWNIYNIILPHDLSLYVWQCATKKHLQHYIASRSQPLCLAVCNQETFTTLYCLLTISAFMSGGVQPRNIYNIILPHDLSKKHLQHYIFTMSGGVQPRNIYNIILPHDLSLYVWRCATKKHLQHYIASRSHIYNIPLCLAVCNQETFTTLYCLTISAFMSGGMQPRNIYNIILQETFTTLYCLMISRSQPLCLAVYNQETFTTLYCLMIAAFMSGSVQPTFTTLYCLMISAFMSGSVQPRNLHYIVSRSQPLCLAVCNQETFTTLYCLTISAFMSGSVQPRNIYNIIMSGSVQPWNCLTISAFMSGGMQPRNIYNIILPHDLSLYVWQCTTKKHLQHYIASRTSQPLCLAVCNQETFTLYCLTISAFMSGSVQPRNIYNIILPYDLSLYVWRCATKKHLQHYIASRSQPLCLAACNQQTC